MNLGNDSIISIKNLSKRYGGFEAIRNISIDFPRNQIIGLLGPNGSGKTTLIKVIVNLLRNFTGSVKIDGFDPGLESKKIVAYLPDYDYLDNSKTFKDAVEYFSDFYEDFDKAKANRLADELRLPKDVKFKSLSKGTKEKVQLILVLSRNAKVYIFDEPIAGVDPVARDIVFRLIRENVSKDSTVIISTHLIADCEDYLDYVIFLKEGEIALRSDAARLKASTGKTINSVFKEVFSNAY